MGLRVTIKTRLKWTDFQDIHFNPAEESYKQKENSETSFITVASNHPKTIIKQLSQKRVNRISKLSSSEEVLK